MIPVKEAIAQALAYLDEFGDLLPRGGTRLEETEFDDRKTEWVITVSFPEDLLMNSRIYKQFRIDGESGAVKSMKNRSLVS
jgi:hypothetical protein